MGHTGGIGSQFEFYQEVEAKNNSLKIHSASDKPIFKITRPADTIAYSGGDVLSSGGTVMGQFEVLQSTGQESWIIGGQASKSVSATTEPNIDLHFFSSATTITGDNTFFERLNKNELDHHLGYITYSTWKTFGNAAVSTGIIEAPILLKSLNSTNKLIYAVPIMRARYVPTSEELFSFQLDLDQN